MCVRTVGGEEDIQLVHGVQPVLDAPEMTWWKICNPDFLTRAIHELPQHDDLIQALVGGR